MINELASIAEKHYGQGASNKVRIALMNNLREATPFEDAAYSGFDFDVIRVRNKDGVYATTRTKSAKDGELFKYCVDDDGTDVRGLIAGLEFADLYGEDDRYRSNARTIAENGNKAVNVSKADKHAKAFGRLMSVGEDRVYRESDARVADIDMRKRVEARMSKLFFALLMMVCVYNFNATEIANQLMGGKGDARKAIPYMVKVALHEFASVLKATKADKVRTVH